jgi:hypothetical protein
MQPWLQNGATTRWLAMSNRQQFDEAMAAKAAQPSMPREEWPIGAHLVTPRLGYMHHGIYVGAQRVVHYAGWSRTLFQGPIEEISLAEFAGGRGVSIKSTNRLQYTPTEVVDRARSRPGENRYRLTTNNCEHFCEWCLSGESRSEQVERLVDWVRVPALALARSIEGFFSASWLRAS